MLPQLKVYTTIDDLKYLMFEQPDVISDQIKIHGSWNGNLLELVDVVIKNQGSGLVIDIGAGFGTFSVPLATLNYSKFKFAAFEPLRIINLQLATNVLLNHLDNVKVFNVGLGDKDESVIFYTLDYETNANHGSFSFNHEVNEIRGIIPTDSKESYEFRRLDSYLPEDVKLIKLSAPGMELEVLNGAKETILKNNNPPLVFENWDVEWYREKIDAVYAFLNEVGYQEYHEVGAYVIAFKNAEEKNQLLKESRNNNIFTEFHIVEKEHDAVETLKDQKPLII